MGLDDLDKRLASLDDQFKDAPTEGGGFEKFMPAPGDYSCAFRQVDFFEAKSTGAAFLKIYLEVLLDPRYTGREIEMIYCLEPHLAAPGKPTPTPEKIQQQLGFLKKDLATLGIDVNAPDFSLGQVRPGSPMWDQLIGKTVDVAVVESKKTDDFGKPYVNAYINGVSEPIGSDIPVQSLTGGATSPVAPSDDDIPF